MEEFEVLIEIWEQYKGIMKIYAWNTKKCEGKKKKYVEITKKYESEIGRNYEEICSKSPGLGGTPKKRHEIYKNRKY